jgi:hypothetical protein
MLSSTYTLVFLEGFFLLTFLPITYTRSSSLPFVPHVPAHLILVDLTIIIIHFEEYKPCSTSLSRFHLVLEKEFTAVTSFSFISISSTGIQFCEKTTFLNDGAVSSVYA